MAVCSDSSRNILPVVAPSNDARDALRRAAADGEVQTSVHYAPIHRFSIFGAQPELPLTEEFARRELTLPLYPRMSFEDVARVTGLLARAPAEMVTDRT